MTDHCDADWKISEQESAESKIDKLSLLVVNGLTRDVLVELD